MRNRHTVVVVAVAVLLSVSPVAAASQIVVGTVDISVSSPDRTVEASSTESLEVVLSNRGEVLQGGQTAYEREVKTARNVRARVLEERIDAPISVTTGTRSLGSLPGGATARPTFELEVGEAEPGTYRIPIEVEYAHTRSISYGRFEETERTIDDERTVEYVTVTVEDKPQFEIVAGGPNEIVAGGTGDLAVDLRNTGTQTATDATVSLSTRTPGVFFGTQANPAESVSVRVPELEPSETTDIVVSMGANGDVSPGRYPVVATVEYKNSDGITEQSDRLRTGLVVQREQSFRLQNVSTSDLRVDEDDATIRGTVRNDGPATARNVVVSMDSHPTLTVTNGQSAVGDLAAGERAPVEFTVRVPESAEPGTSSVTFGVEYENADGDLRRLSSPIRESVRIDEERDRFSVVGVNTSVTAGGSDRLAVDLEYAGEETVDNVNAKLFTSDPLSTADDGAYLGTVEPGETVTATFRVSASGDALEKEYGSSVELRYEEPDGDRRFSGSLSVGVPVGAASGGGLPLLPIAGVGAVVVGGGLVVYRRD